MNETLELAIQKAIDNGWNQSENEVRTSTIEKHIEFQVGKEWITVGYEAVIYAHPFAKALWGEEIMSVSSWQSGKLYNIPNGKYEFNGPRWMYHLQQMVIWGDPINYLEENM